MPRARVRIAAALKPGLRSSAREAKRKSESHAEITLTSAVSNTVKLLSNAILLSKLNPPRSGCEELFRGRRSEQRRTPSGPRDVSSVRGRFGAGALFRRSRDDRHRLAAGRDHHSVANRDEPPQDLPGKPPEPREAAFRSAAGSPVSHSLPAG